MKRFLLIFSILVFSSSAQAEWVQIELKARPYVDGRGNALKSIDGMKNRKGIDEFSGGGKDGYPEVKNGEVREWHEKGNSLLVDSKVTVKAPKAVSVKTITDAQAAQIKKDVFGIVKAESGVTK